MDNNKIGKFIVALRKDKNLTQQELGNKLFVTDKAVSKWERGLSFPDITILNKLAEILNVDVSEILNGERGKKDDIDIQKAIDSAIKKINEEKKERINKTRKKMIIIILVVIVLSILVTFSLKLYYNKYHPNIIVEGNNNYLLGTFGNYSLEENGLDALINAMKKTEARQNDKSNISYMNIKLNKNGTIKSFAISLNYFDDDLNYIGNGRYTYEFKKLYYEYTAKEDCADINECNIVNSLTTDYLKSNNVEYISEKLKDIPIKKQMKINNIKNGEVSYNKTYYWENTNVFDMRDNKHIEALTLEDYNQGKGGVAQKGIYLQITLSEGNSSIATQNYRYIFDPINGDILRIDYTMEKDYYINVQKQLLFTRDYGNTWIETDITSDEIDETLTYYRDISLKHSSWFISTNELIPIAYFYGENAKLKISTNNGKTWTEKEFNLTKADYNSPIPNRIVGFTDQNFGYVALGTDWTMGTGEVKKAYFTNDSGLTWDEVELPLNGSRHTLVDFIMYNSNIGIVALNGENDDQFPILYSTIDGGKNWEEVNYLGTNIPDEVQYLYTLDNIEYIDNNYYITLGQGNTRNTKVKFKTSNLTNWNYHSTFQENIHTVG